jgi:hypothetical protein
MARSAPVSSPQRASSSASRAESWSWVVRAGWWPAPGSRSGDAPPAAGRDQGFQSHTRMCSTLIGTVAPVDGGHNSAHGQTTIIARATEELSSFKLDLRLAARAVTVDDRPAVIHRTVARCRSPRP